MADIAVSVKGLKKSFKNVEVLKGIDFSVPRGEMLALLGPNGAGKTTTVKILSTLLAADEGEAFIDGISVTKNPHEVRSRIGLTGQYAAVDEYLTGRQNLEMMGQLYHLDKKASARRAQELLEQFHLTDAAERDAKTYSGGMRRRLDLALSLVATPPIIFLDEPTTGLDPRSRIAMWEVIENLMAQGTTILLTTQYLEEADRLANKIAVIDDGRVIAYGTADELKKQVGDERVELVISEDSDFEEARNLVQGDGLQVRPEERLISVSTDGSVSALKNILDAFSAKGIELDSMSVHKPTLDDAFLRLTGRTTTKEESTV